MNFLTEEHGLLAKGSVGIGEKSWPYPDQAELRATTEDEKYLR